MVSIYWARMKLWQWGKAVQDYGIGYPAMSAHEQIRSGSGVMSVDRGLPDDLAEIDLQVLKAPVRLKTVLVEHYTKKGSGDEHAARLGLSRSAYFERKRDAEQYISEMI